jgi:hypothetical protein
MAKPKYRDARLMVQLAQWGTAMGATEAWAWLRSDEFVPEYAAFVEKFPPGSEGYARATSVCMWMETIGTLYKQGLFNGELLFDWLAVGAMWNLLKGFALGEREKTGIAALWENFEALADAAEGS